MVLAHASLAHGGAWAGVAEALGPGYALVAPDLPGHGRAADLGPGDDYHASATAVMRSAAGTGPVDLIGHSLGGTVMLRLALESPARVRRLVLIEPVLFAAVCEGRPAAENAGFAAALAAGDATSAAALFVDTWGGEGGWAGLSTRQQAAAIRRIGHVAAVDAALTDDAAGLLAPGRLEALAIPVLMIRGAASLPLARAIAARLAERLPDARLAEVAGAGHMAPLTHPGAVAALIDGFLGPD